MGRKDGKKQKGNACLQSISPYSKMVLEFGKALDMKFRGLLAVEPTEVSGSPWATLGYFDTMRAYSLPLDPSLGNWMPAVREHNLKLSKKIDGSCYIQPLYIVERFETEEKRENYRIFWEDQDKNFLFITLIHGNDNCSNSYSAPLDRERHNTLRGVVDGILNQNEFPHVYYRTLELSDVVLIWKSDCLATALSQLNVLAQQRLVGDLNTFSCISSNHLKKFMDKGSLPRVPETTVERVAMQFIVRDMQEVNPFFSVFNQHLKSNPYLITGTEDVQAIWTDIRESDFLSALAHSFFDEQLNELFCEAFRESETKIGVSFGSNKGGDNDEIAREKKTVIEQKEERQSALTLQCQDLLTQFLRSLETSPWKVPGKDDSWLSWTKPVCTQLNELLDMSHSCVLDKLCYLSLDGVNLFCKEAGKLLQSPEKVASTQIEKIQRFVRGWGILMEQTGRADGRFTHLPGFSPPLYDIPSTLLEFLLAFTKRCGQLIGWCGDDQYTFSTIAVPKLCRRIKVISVFDQPPPCDRLLFVDIPLDLLYDPFAVLYQLVHELSHFCGDEWRDRGHRANYFLYVCANHLAVELKMQTREVVSEIYKRMQEEYDEAKEDIGDDILYLDSIHMFVKETIPKYVADELFFTKLIEIYENGLNLNICKPQTIFQHKLECFVARQNYLYGEKKIAFTLFTDMVKEQCKEGYADVSAIFVLGIKVEEYLRMPAKELELYADVLNGKRSYHAEQDKRMGMMYTSIVQRWALVCAVCFADVAFPTFQKGSVLQTFASDVDKCRQFISSNRNKLAGMSSLYGNCVLDGTTLNSIKDYLANCRKMMLESEESLEEKHKSKREEYSFAEIRDIFRQASEGNTLWCEGCDSLIEAYEQNLCKGYKGV